MDSSEKDKPQASFILIAYKQEKYIREAIEGAFNQTYSPLEIILSDDNSPDSTYEIMEEMAKAYGGPHKVILNKNHNNLGLVGHINKVLLMGTGEVLVLAAGDDISRPNRVLRSVELIQGGTVAVSFNTQIIGDPSVEAMSDQDITDFTYSSYFRSPFFHLNGASRSFLKSALNYYDEIDPECPTEDSVMLLRLLMRGSVKYSNEIMVDYRVHEFNLSSEQGLRKMDHGRIYSQYKRDILKLKNLSVIDTKLSVSLLVLFWLKKEYLKVRYSSHGESLFCGIYGHFIKFLLRVYSRLIRFA